MLKLLFTAFFFAECLSAMAETIKVGTYNIRTRTQDKGTLCEWVNRKSDLLDLIRKLDLDVFGLQEAHADQLDYIAEALTIPFAERENRRRRIDYIYVSEGIKVNSYKTVNDPRPGTKLYPSDHFPVIADIEL